MNPFRFGEPPWNGGSHRSVNGSGTVWQYPKGTRVFDCSGYAVAAYRQHGVDLAAKGAFSSGTIANSPHPETVSRDQLQPGDRITYNRSNGIGHVVIYAGDGKTLEASESRGVHEGSVDWDRVNTIKRVPLP